MHRHARLLTSSVGMGFAAGVVGLRETLSAPGIAPAAGPVAAKKPVTVTFGAHPTENRGPNPMPTVSAVDPYFWMRDDDRKDPAVLAHLRAENAHTDARTSHLTGLGSSLYKELLGHVKETDDSAPYPNGDV